MPSNSPAFQFYPADFLADEHVALMSLAARGAYITLLCYCWREGSIPAETDKLARLCGVDSNAMAELMAELSPCFSSAIGEPSRLINLRLYEEKEKQENHRKERALAGQKGAEKRWKRRRKSIETKVGAAEDSLANVLPMAKNGSSSSSSSSSSNNNKDMASKLADSPNHKASVDEIFTYWQSRCDHPGAKLTAERKTKIIGRLKDGYSVDQIKTAIDGCASSRFHRGENENGKRYDDIELICRNGSKLENFISIKASPVAGGKSSSTPAVVETPEWYKKMYEAAQ